MPAPANYVDVATRIAEFREKYPEGSLQRVSVEFVRDFGGADWVAFTAAAYRHPNDTAPGHGTAWERVPGLTNFTKNSELQNAETSAWGRAIVAVLAADTRKQGVASSNEVEPRQAERTMSRPNLDELVSSLRAKFSTSEGRKEFVVTALGGEDIRILSDLTDEQIATVKSALANYKDGTEPFEEGK